jgi:putative flavoprotein involved in K+ transport
MEDAARRARSLGPQPFKEDSLVMRTDAPEHFDVAVVGAGQAGLAAGYFLSAQDRSFVILDAAHSPGSAWADRWASLVLFTPRRYDGLSGLAFPGEPDGYPSRDEVVSYLNLYAVTFELPVELGSRVWSMRKEGERFVLELAERTIEADAVVVATGPFQTPRVPRFAPDFGPKVFQIHSADYNVPTEVPGGTVLVVGGGNTGFQIASELSSTHEVHLSVGSHQSALPQRFLGRDLFWWLLKTGLLSKTTDSTFGRRLKARDALIGSSPSALRRQGVSIEPRAGAASGRTVTFADDTELAVDAVIWACGFDRDNSWIVPSITTADGQIRHRRGVTTSPDCTSSGWPGSRRGNRRCSAGSRTTPSTSPQRSPHGRPTTRRRPTPCPIEQGSETALPTNATSSASSATTPVSSETVPPTIATTQVRSVTC